MDDNDPDSLDLSAFLSSPARSRAERAAISFRPRFSRIEMDSDDDEHWDLSNPLEPDWIVDKVYDRKSDPLRIASADGIHFYVPKEVVLQSVFLSAKISAISPPILELTDRVYERATTIRTLLDILSFKNVLRTYSLPELLPVLLLANKLTLPNAASFCIQHLKKDVERGYGKLHALFGFAVSAVVDSEDLAALWAVCHLKNNGHWRTTDIAGLATQMPVVYALALANFLENNSPRSRGPDSPKDLELKEKFLQCLKSMKEGSSKTIGKRKRD